MRSKTTTKRIRREIRGRGLPAGLYRNKSGRNKSALGILPATTWTQLLRSGLIIAGQSSQSRLLIGKISEDRMQVGHVQDLPRARIQIHGMQLSIVLRAE